MVIYKGYYCSILIRIRGETSRAVNSKEPIKTLRVSPQIGVVSYSNQVNTIAFIWIINFGWDKRYQGYLTILGGSKWIIIKLIKYKYKSKPLTI